MSERLITILRPGSESMATLRKKAIVRAGLAAPVRSALTTGGHLADLTSRFHGGETTGSAVDSVRQLRRGDVLASVHLRRPPVRGRADAELYVASYTRLVDALAAAGLASGSDLSLKLEQVGFRSTATWAEAVGRLREVVAACEAVGLTTTIDMEGPEEVDSTLEAVRELRADFPSVGVALQSLLRRTEADCAALAHAGSRVRLVKGGYQAPPDQVVGGRIEVDRSYARCLRLLMEGDGYPMVATHDPRLIRVAERLALRAHRSHGDHEFQMLQGIAVGEQRRLAASGSVVRAYVAYGPEWYSWLVRRVSERPSNLLHVARAARGRHANAGATDRTRHPAPSIDLSRARRAETPERRRAAR